MTGRDVLYKVVHVFLSVLFGRIPVSSRNIPSDTIPNYMTRNFVNDELPVFSFFTTFGRVLGGSFLYDKCHRWCQSLFEGQLLRL